MYSYLWIGILAAVLLGARWWSFARNTRHDEAHPEFRLAAIAGAMGLSIQRGRPEFNLAVGSHPHLFLVLLTGIQKHRTKILLSGRSQDKDILFELVDSRLYFRTRHVTWFDHHEFRAELRILNTQLPTAFEAWTASANRYLSAEPRTGLPCIRTGQEGHTRWNVATNSEAVAARVAEWIATWAEKPSCFVHVIAEPGELRFVLTRDALLWVVPHLAQIQQSLLALLKALEREDHVT